MARGEEGTSSQPPSQASVDQFLRSLSDRPNVESTIILSRKDGSIIKASGFNTVEKRRRARSLAARQGPPGNADQPSLGSSGELVKDVSQSPAEELAVSILKCVQAADALGSNLAALSSEGEYEDYVSRKAGRSEGNGSELEPELDEHKASVSNESAVQLLRLRVKQREIIIFPDPHYLVEHLDAYLVAHLIEAMIPIARARRRGH
ncbi:hypothetical protein DV738_g3802, partial [Chaetothyriales sp. CBS 135597]